MSLFYIFLTILMFFDCLILVLLVLLQLPKKEAGAGVAFGGGTTDALFGAGSGNVLTKITKYAAGIFFGLAILMAMVASRHPESGGEVLQDEIRKTSGTIPIAAPPSTPSTTPGLLQTPLLSNLPPVQSDSSAPAAPATTKAAPKAASPATNK
jgi:preprotein translocase subunit SecG